jgi:glycosyltransferase involved in cell wall biosynthesis
MQPAISIVVPSYNQRPEFVSECLASTFAQKGASYEVIFVDSNSKPETRAAAEPFRNRSAHFICQATKGRPTRSIRVCVWRTANWSHG